MLYRQLIAMLFMTYCLAVCIFLVINFNQSKLVYVNLLLHCVVQSISRND